MNRKEHKERRELLGFGIPFLRSLRSLRLNQSARLKDVPSNFSQPKNPKQTHAT